MGGVGAAGRKVLSTHSEATGKGGYTKYITIYWTGTLRHTFIGGGGEA